MDILSCLQMLGKEYRKHINMRKNYGSIFLSLTNWLTDWLCGLWNLNVNATFVKALYWSLSSANWIKFILLIPTSARSILVLSSHLCLNLPILISNQNFESSPPVLHSDYMICSFQSLRFNNSDSVKYKSRSPLLWNFLTLLFDL